MTCAKDHCPNSVEYRVKDKTHPEWPEVKVCGFHMENIILSRISELRFEPEHSGKLDIEAERMEER